MARSIALAHVDIDEHRIATGAWGPFTLKSAFQPIFSFDRGKLVMAAFEGLLRPFRDGEVMSPPAFFASLSAAERLHVETLARTLHILNAGAHLDPAKKLFINFDPSVFSDREIIANALRDMRLTMHEAGIDARDVVCEVTEQRSTSQQALEGFVAALRDDGFRIAVDDYGAQQSDMERISALKPDIVKFDGRWIARLMETRQGVALLALMVGEFSARGITVVFEGIEEGWQIEVAEAAGAHMVQGFALARPELAPTSFAVLHPDPQGPAATDAHVRQRRVGGSSAKAFGRRVAS
ncbi:EAL domain-containing protein [Mesorhizobium microcysteis]|uniref:EAL domain-containing protein n=1 Tax=Neoaquamicrobium microcysteis TaxID=2682781 RepID=A0A5D4GR23_9HYPH|nr:EAL domain-containing protein [Mesorhizobium microcysteis]TYR30492.1 EAL domain-containing protein [Mesorhizobium microcysteis]